MPADEIFFICSLGLVGTAKRIKKAGQAKMLIPFALLCFAMPRLTMPYLAEPCNAAPCQAINLSRPKFIAQSISTVVQLSITFLRFLKIFFGLA